MTDQTIEIKKCAISWQAFTITQWDLDFYDKISPTFAGQKFQIPTPTLCPEERQRRRLAFRNERNLYRRTCDASGKQIISIYSPDKPYKVYDQKIRRSDSRDAMDYGRDFDFSKTFTENMRELIIKVPRVWIINDNWVGSLNCDYTNDFVWGKNCYMCFEMGDCEDCLFSHHSNGSKSCTDCDECTWCQFCYEVTDSLNCYNCKYSQWMNNCIWCFYSAFLISCTDCVFCCGLTNQKYCYMNKQYSKEDYEKKVEQIFNDVDFKNEQINLFANVILRKHPNNLIISSENCTGYNIMSSNNLKNCHNCFYSNDVSYWLSLYQVKNSMDIQCRKTELCLEWQTLDESYGSWFCSRSSRSKFIWYCDNCHDSQNLFWCVGLRNKSYCIFNKQYTKEEYENQVAKIITHMQSTGEWWEFFHPSLSPFGYNETVAQEYYPLQQSDSLLKRYKWSDYESPKPVSDKVIQGKDLPESIDEVQDDILHYAIACEVTGKLFRIQPQELVFYRKHHIPLPRKHPDQRHLERLALRK